MCLLQNNSGGGSGIKCKNATQAKSRTYENRLYFLEDNSTALDMRRFRPTTVTYISILTYYASVIFVTMAAIYIIYSRAFPMTVTIPDVTFRHPAYTHYT